MGARLEAHVSCPNENALVTPFGDMLEVLPPERLRRKPHLSRYTSDAREIWDPVWSPLGMWCITSSSPDMVAAACAGNAAQGPKSQASTQR